MKFIVNWQLEIKYRLLASGISIWLPTVRVDEFQKLVGAGELLSSKKQHVLAQVRQPQDFIRVIVGARTNTRGTRGQGPRGIRDENRQHAIGELDQSIGLAGVQERLSKADRKWSYWLETRHVRSDLMRCDGKSDDREGQSELSLLEFFFLLWIWRKTLVWRGAAWSGDSSWRRHGSRDLSVWECLTELAECSRRKRKAEKKLLFAWKFPTLHKINVVLRHLLTGTVNS